MTIKFLKLAVILTALSLTVSACSLPTFFQHQAAPSSPVTTSVPVSTSTPSAAKAPNYTDKLKQFNDYAAVAQFLNNLDYLYNDNQVKASSSAADIYIAPLSSTASSSNIIQSDGTNVYALDKDKLIISSFQNGHLKLLSQATFKSRPSGLVLVGHFLAVYGLDTQIINEPVYKSLKRKDAFSFLTIFDVSNPSQPRQTRNLEFEGVYKKLSVQGDYLYLLTVTPGVYRPSYPVVPSILENGQILANSCAGVTACFAPPVYYFDLPYSAYNFVSLVAVDITDNTQALSGLVYISPLGQLFRLSDSYLDVAYSPQVNYHALNEQSELSLLYPELNTSTSRLVDAIKGTANTILSSSNKQLKIAQVLETYLLSLPTAQRSVWQNKIASSTAAALPAVLKQNNYTSIYQFALNGDKLSYQAFGQVPGHLLNDSAWDKSGDYLRLLTVSNPAALNVSSLSSSYYNNVYVLGPSLQRIGALENLTTANPLAAAYFLGNRLYLASSQADDPLFTISLNDPSQPAILGAVQIPGKNNYLQSLDSNGRKFIVLSGQGQVAYSDGSIGQGLTVSLLDLSDLKKPRELFSYLIGPAGSKSIALADHQAFTYLSNQNILVVPVTLLDNQNHLDFSGVTVLSLTGDKFNLVGQIDHSSGGHFTAVDTWQGITYYDNTVKRSRLLSGDLLTFSNKFSLL